MLGSLAGGLGVEKGLEVRVFFQGVELGDQEPLPPYAFLEGPLGVVEGRQALTQERVELSGQVENLDVVWRLIEHFFGQAGGFVLRPRRARH